VQSLAGEFTRGSQAFLCLLLNVRKKKKGRGGAIRLGGRLHE
jgi:hypothetical protein